MIEAKRFFVPFLFGVTLVGALLLFAGPACAQYKHGALGANLGFLYTFNVGGDPGASNVRTQNGYGVGPGGSLALEGSYRFLDHWAVGAEAHISLHGCGVPNDICDSGATPLMLSVFTNLRYYFLTDDVRPYVDLSIGYWQSLAFVKINVSEFGPSLGVGLDWFVVEEISIGFRARYGLQLFVGDKGLIPFHQVMGMLTFAAYL